MKDTDGPAFPQPMLDTMGSSGIVTADEMNCGGMTLRDYFAAKAIAPNLSAIGRADWSSPEECSKAVAKLAYILSDAMLAERNK